MSVIDFAHRTLPVIDKRVLRMGLAPSFGIDAAGIDWALDEGGMQYVFWTPRMKAATGPLRRALQRDRERFCLSSPHVDVVLTGPKTLAQLRDNLAALERGPLEADEMAWMRDFGPRAEGRGFDWL